MSALLLTNIRYCFDGKEDPNVERKLFCDLIYEAVARYYLTGF